MNAQELIDELKAQGITLQWDGASINWEAPFDFVPPEEIVELVKKNWDEIIKRINGPPPEWLLSGTNIVRLTQGDCLGVMGMYPDNLVDLIVTDPPYGYQFMGKDWDKAVPSVEIWKECLRVLKPGGFAFIMSAPRQDVLARMIINLEDAGFRTGFTSLYWTYASGFPKAHNISRSIDNRDGYKGKIVGYKKGVGGENINDIVRGKKVRNTTESGAKGVGAYGCGAKQVSVNVPIREPSEKAKQFNGSYGGYQPKPAVEVIIIAQKPLSEKTFVDQALSNKKGITWLDDCRIPYGNESVWSAEGGVQWSPEKKWNKIEKRSGNESGRFPANLLISDNVLDDGLDHTSHPMDCVAKNDGGVCYGKYSPHRAFNPGDTGGYSRFFSLDAWIQKNQQEGLNFNNLEEIVQHNLPFMIIPKASKNEKNFGCDELDEKPSASSEFRPNHTKKAKKGENGNPYGRWKKLINNHPTVKPILLMSYLITMGSREGDIVLDPFCGSGTTCLAARLLKRPCIGIEKDPGYAKIAAARIRELTLLSYIKQGQQKRTNTKSKGRDHNPVKRTSAGKTVIFHDKSGIALTKQTKIDSHNFPFTLNTGIGCHFGCRYCYLQGYPFNRHAKFPVEAKVKLWIADKLDKELGKYKHLPQHLKRVQVNVAAEGYLPLVMSKVKKEKNRDIMAEVLQVFRKHWEKGNHWMVHLITKSHMVLKHLDIISAMKDQVQLELTITTLDENRRRKMEGLAPSVAKRLQVIRRFSSAGVFVRAMCMPLIGDRKDAETIKAACFENGARAFKHKGVNYWDEKALLNGETTKATGRHDDVFEDLLVKSCEPYRVDSEIQKMTVKMPVIVNSGKTKRWKGYKEENLEDREMTMEVSGYSEINDIDWGYVK